MATTLPAKLKSADIQRFALRASQLETAKPAIAYWCEYWIVNQLLSRGLHSADDECLKYTTTMMDKLEKTKSKYAHDDAIMDDAAGQAYVEQFGSETFDRADRAVLVNKVTKQTADTFMAASTFLELLNIWGDPAPDIHAKIRYAKWNAVRIVKAIKDGRDPNESNPKPEPVLEEQELQPLDPNDPEVQALGGADALPLQASVEEVPDEQDTIESRLAVQSANGNSLHPSAQPSAQHTAEPSPLEPQDHAKHTDLDVSPMENSPHERDGSVGGGYFPEVPTETGIPDLPSAPDTVAGEPSMPPDLPDPSQLPPPGFNGSNDSSTSHPQPTIRTISPPPSAPQDFYLNSTAPDTSVSAPAPSSMDLHPQQGRSAPAPQQSPVPSTLPRPLPQPTPRPIPPPPQPRQLLPPSSTPALPAVDAAAAAGRPPTQQVAYNTDDMAIAKAQKHARWAISALNFEDAETAVKELRAALTTLGAAS